MPKFFCDYCDVYLTHDSMAVRKAHNTGRNHIRNVIDYYQEIGHEKAQSVIDSITSSYAAEGQAHANPMLPHNQPGMGMGMGMGGPGGQFAPPPFAFPGGQIPPPFPGMPPIPPPQGGFPGGLPPLPLPNGMQPPFTFPPPTGSGSAANGPPGPGGLPFPPPGLPFLPPGMPGLPPPGMNNGPGSGTNNGTPGSNSPFPPPPGFPGFMPPPGGFPGAPPMPMAHQDGRA